MPLKKKLRIIRLLQTGHMLLDMISEELFEVKNIEELAILENETIKEISMPKDVKKVSNINSKLN